MSFWGPVAARQLHRRRVRLRDTALERATLFPFFDREGQVSALMLVWPASPRIVLVEHPGLFSVPLLGDVRMRAGRQALVGVDAGQAAAMTAGSWHYDPWWLLREARFRGHPAVPVLKATNCVERFTEPVSACYFSRDLASLQTLDVEDSDSEAQVSVPFTADRLPERSAKDPYRSPAKGWRLDPFWQRESAR